MVPTQFETRRMSVPLNVEADKSADRVLRRRCVSFHLRFLVLQIASRGASPRVPALECVWREHSLRLWSGLLRSRRCE